MKATYLISALVLACFGPYLLPLLRMEQLVLYVSFAGVVLFVLLGGAKIVYKQSLAIPLSLFVFLIFWSTASGIVRGESVLQYSYLASFESYLQPVTIMILVSVLLRRASLEILTQTLRAVIIMMCVGAAFNAIVAIYQLFYGPPWFVDYFLPARSELTGKNVWDRALGMGRIIGTFGSPLEGGVIYGSALIGATYLYSVGALKPLWYALAAVVIAVGGILTISKGFFVALALTAFYHLKKNGTYQGAKSNKWVISFMVVLIGGGIFFAGASGVGWKGLERWGRFFMAGEDDSVVYLYSGGRYGSEGAAITYRIQGVLEESPVIGYGMQYYDVFDSAFLEVLYFGGLVGLAIYLGIFFALFRISSGRVLDRGVGFYARTLVIYAFIASFGAPILTKNKFEVMFWVQITVIALLAERRSNRGNLGLGRMVVRTSGVETTRLRRFRGDGREWGPGIADLRKVLNRSCLST